MNADGAGEAGRVEGRAYDAILDVPEDAATAPLFRALPEAPGVAVFEARDGRAVLIATTRNLRELARRRLSEPDADEPRSAMRVDHRAITARVCVRVAWTGVEADAAYLEEARARLPLAHRVVLERWRPWFVTVDPDAEHPEWGKTNLGPAAGKARALGKRAGVEEHAPLDAARLIGPIANKDAAGRVIERAIDGFDLCRYHHLLVQAPKATACAYKEMARCPAPCDGSEPLEQYRQRVREAAEGLCASTRGRVIEVLHARVREAAATQAFEVAARAQRAIAACEAMTSGALASVERMSDWRGVLVGRAAQGRAAVLVWSGLRLTPVVDVLPAGGAAAVAEIWPAVRAAVERGRAPSGLDAGTLDAVAAVARMVLLPAKKRGGVWLRGDELSEPALLKAVRAVGKPADDSGVQEQDIEPA